MATYKVIDAEKLDNDLKSVADSIRAKSGITEVMNFPDGFNSAIAGIISGSQNPDLPEVAENLDTELNEQEELISELKSVLINKSNSTNSGIIDITELPTSDIDENVVYRLTETVQTEKTEVYIKDGNYVATFAEYCVDEGVPTTPNIYVVNDLTNMLETDVQTYSAIHIYILRSDGIAYANAPAYGGITTVGLFGWQAMGYDKGFTEDIQCEAEDGVYTTIEAFKEVVRYFIRENGEWKEITAYTIDTTAHGFTNVYPLSGHITTVATVLSGEVEEIDESWFIKPNGEYVDFIRSRQFAYSNLKTATIPHFIYGIENQAFIDCDDLTTVTFKGTPYYLNSDIFQFCSALTTINVPWGEDDPINGMAPWGATYAKINYNYTEG